MILHRLDGPSVLDYTPPRHRRWPMGMSKVTIQYEGRVFSPFSGKRSDGDDGPNTRDRTLLFVFYGDAGSYAFVSKRCAVAAREAGVKDPEALSPVGLARKLKLSGGLLLEVDAGWNGLNYYAFAPVEEPER